MIRALLFAPLILVAGLVAGCNSKDASELTQDATKLGKTAVRAAGNAQLAGRVNAQLAQTKGVSLEKLKVESEGGTVTLKGTIRNAAERNKILRLTKDIRGVEKVVDQTKLGK